MNSSSAIVLGDVCEFINGGSWSDKEYREHGIPVIKVTNMVNGGISMDQLSYIPQTSLPKYKKHVLKQYDLVIASVGSHPNQPNSVVGRTSAIPREADGFLLNQNAACIRVSKPEILHPVFLHYLTKTKLFAYYASSRARGSANQVRLAISELSKFRFELPPLPTQKKIASILSAYDDLIDNNKQRIKLLEEMAEEIYKEWFVRMRFPGYQDCKFLNKEGKEVPHGTPGALPDGWENRGVFQLSDVTYGFPFASKDFTDAKVGLPIIRIRDIKNNRSRTYSPQIADEKYFVENGDLLVGMDGDFHVGKWAGNRAYLNQRVVRFRPKSEAISKTFIYHSFKTEIDFLNQIISGTTVAHLSDRDLKKIKIGSPPEEIMKLFKVKTDTLLELEVQLQLKNQVLQETRDLLLPRLISGKLNVDELDLHSPSPNPTN